MPLRSKCMRSCLVIAAVLAATAAGGAEGQAQPEAYPQCLPAGGHGAWPDELWKRCDDGRQVLRVVRLGMHREELSDALAALKTHSVAPPLPVTVVALFPEQGPMTQVALQASCASLQACDTAAKRLLAQLGKRYSLGRARRLPGESLLGACDVRTRGELQAQACIRARADAPGRGRAWLTVTLSAGPYRQLPPADVGDR